MPFRNYFRTMPDTSPGYASHIIHGAKSELTKFELPERGCDHFDHLADPFTNWSVPLSYLSRSTVQLISSLLSRKVLIYYGNNCSRNWRALAYCLGFHEVHIYCFSRESNPANRVLIEWAYRDGKKATIEKLVQLYIKIGRCDFLLEEVSQHLSEDVNRYWKMVENYNANLIGSPTSLQPLDKIADRNILTEDDLFRRDQVLAGVQLYDALVLYANNDIQFASEMISILENEHQFRLCVENREIRCSFLLDVEKVSKLIFQRCKKVIVILTQSFLLSDTHRKFFAFLNSISLEQRKSIIMPCLYDNCKVPQEIAVCNKLRYYTANNFWSYWDTLSDFIRLRKPSPLLFDDEIDNAIDASAEENNEICTESATIENSTVRIVETTMTTMTRTTTTNMVSSSSSSCVEEQPAKNSILAILFDEKLPPLRRHETLRADQDAAAVAAAANTAAAATLPSKKKHHTWLRKIVPHQYYDYKNSKKQRKMEKFTKQLQGLALVY